MILIGKQKTIKIVNVGIKPIICRFVFNSMIVNIIKVINIKNKPNTCLFARNAVTPEINIFAIIKPKIKLY
jgi:hypothetical protein